MLLFPLCVGMCATMVVAQWCWSARESRVSVLYYVDPLRRYPLDYVCRVHEDGSAQLLSRDEDECLLFCSPVGVGEMMIALQEFVEEVRSRPAKARRTISRLV